VGTVLAADFTTERPRNWHHWRGPDANGVGALADPPVEWSEDKNIKWKVEVPGKGSATPIVWNDRVFVLTAVETDRKGKSVAADTQPESPAAPQNGQRGRSRGFGRGETPTNYYQFTVLCFDRQTGAKLWEQIAAEEVPHEGHHDTNTFASGSPTTDGSYLYASFGSAGIFCYDLDGKLQWKRDLGNMQTRNAFGEGGSPTLSGDTLIVPWDHEGPSFVTALDAKTGETRWKVDRDEKSTWATPLVVEGDGRTQVVLNGSNRVRSYDLHDGSLIWECGGQVTNPIPSPITEKGLVYCMTGYRGNAVYAIPLTAHGDITDTDKIAWHRTDNGPYVSSPVIYKGLIYHTKARSATLSCLKPDTGEVVVGPIRLPELRDLYASPVAAADRIYFTDRNGVTLVLQHGPELKVLATNKLGEGIDASPALVGKELFLRGQQHLYCIANP
jgi:outer membrane protein assembly factor BamB